LFFLFALTKAFHPPRLPFIGYSLSCLPDKIRKKRRTIMANVYIEARPKGRPEGSPIDDYVVETQGDQVLGTFSTQRAAIDWAKGKGHSPHVARVRHLNDKKKPDHWRAV
jgi:hypothetical protein